MPRVRTEKGCIDRELCIDRDLLWEDSYDLHIGLFLFPSLGGRSRGGIKVLGCGCAGREIVWQRAWIIEADANVRSSIKRTYYHTSVRYE